jgi:glycerol uptake facilitator protein
MNAPLAELLGTMILVLLGDGVVANVVLKGTKGNNGGWIVITTGWAMAVTVGVYCTAAISGAHLNPAVTVAMAYLGKLPWADVPAFIGAQVVGAFLGAVLVWLAYLPHWKITEDKGAKLAVFSTGPAIRHTVSNLICEIIGTFSTGFGPALVGVIVWAIGLSLGGPTGYAINPARDLGPRIAHFILPIPGKGDSDWGYAWIPVVGPIIGGLIGAVIYTAFWGMPAAA